MKFSIKLLITTTIIAGSLSPQLVKASVEVIQHEKTEFVIASDVINPDIEATQDEQIEEEIINQIFAIAEQRCGYSFKAVTLAEKRAVLEQMSLEMKEEILEQMVQMLLDDIDHPFAVPRGTNYSQLDMFFILSRTLMCHNKELCERLTRCIGERELYKLSTKLNKCLVLINPKVKEKLTPKPSRLSSFITKIKIRMSTKTKTVVDAH